MNTDLSGAAQCFGLYDNEEIMGFCAVIHQPHPKNSRIKRCSRIVILPDYQGIGLGYKFLREVAKHYHDKGYDFSIVTSARNFIYKLSNSKEWSMVRLGRNRMSNTGTVDKNRKSTRTNCKTASFFYTGN